MKSEEVAKMKFPKRFAIEGLNPHDVKVVVVVSTATGFIQKVYANLASMPEDFTFRNLCGPMADKHEGVYALRFECKETYTMMSN